MTAPVLVEVVRSGVVESTHLASVIALRPDGTPALALGEVDVPMLPRSANKPLQAVALLDAGWQPPDEESLALATASHSGSPRHLDVARRTLTAAGLDESALRCPPLLPLGPAEAQALLRAGGEPSRLTMTCSGKHAAMLATCVANGWPVEGYLTAEHPLQRAIIRTVERLAGEQVQHVVVDGCGAPQHALTLGGLARGFAAVASGDGSCRRAAQAMRRHPDLVGGAGRLGTRLMLGLPGLIVKGGVEAVIAAALPDGSAAAVKVADGGDRARMPVLVAALRALGASGEVLDELATAPVLGGGAPVGEVRVASPLG